jgi:hypothetical protein
MQPAVSTPVKTAILCNPSEDPDSPDKQMAEVD